MPEFGPREQLYENSLLTPSLWHACVYALFLNKGFRCERMVSSFTFYGHLLHWRAAVRGNSSGWAKEMKE